MKIEGLRREWTGWTVDRQTLAFLELLSEAQNWAQKQLKLKLFITTVLLSQRLFNK